MTVEHIGLALHHSQAKGPAKLVLIGIANHEGDGGAFPAMGTLAVYAGIDVSGVRRHIRTLVALGEIDVKYQEGGSARQPDHMRPNLFRVLITCPTNCEGAPKHRLLCDTCNEPLAQSRRKAGTCIPGNCCPLSGAMAERFNRPRCQGDHNRNHAPGLCDWPAETE